MNTVNVWIPPALREFAGGNTEVSLAAADVASALSALGDAYPDIRLRVLTPDGDVRPLVNVFVGEDNIRTLDGLATALSDGDTLAIIPAVAGG